MGGFAIIYHEIELLIHKNDTTNIYLIIKYLNKKKIYYLILIIINLKNKIIKYIKKTNGCAKKSSNERI